MTDKDDASGGEISREQPKAGGPWLKMLLAGAAIVLVGFLFVQGSVGSAVTKISELFMGPVTPGILSLEPPQVYTRERLVNDRFRQANWLENQLDATNKPTTIDEIGRVLSTIQQKTEMVLELKLPAADKAETEEEEAAKTEAPRVPLAPALGSFGQRLVETDKLRSRLRTDLMDTLLDDGHDIEGNTLYRLNFDAVVMPSIGETRYPGTAVYVIKALNPYAPLKEKHCPKGAGEECKPASRSDNWTESELQWLRQKQLSDDIELLRDWQTETQRFLTHVVEHRIDFFRKNGRLDNPVDPKEDIALDWYMRLRLIENFLDAVVMDPEIWALCPAPVNATAEEKAKPLEPTGANVNRCQDWIAKTLGLKWRSADSPRDPGFDLEKPGAEGIEASFRRAIRLAGHINLVRDEIGFQALEVQEMGKGETDAGGTSAQLVNASTNSCIEKTSAGNASTDGCPDQAGQAPPKKPADDQSSQDAPPVFEDAEHKKALMRMITVWQAMREWELLPPPPAASAGSAQDIPPPPEESVETGDTEESPSREQRLFSRLQKYQEYEPTDASINASRTKLLAERLGEPKFKTGAEGCMPDTVEERRAPDARFEYYHCVMIHGKAGQTADNLIAEFVLARLRDELPIYDWKNHLKLSDFLDIQLSGCGTTGCRIQVKQHKVVPMKEFIGGRENTPDMALLADKEPQTDKVKFVGFIDQLLADPEEKMESLIGADKAWPNFFNVLLPRYETVPVTLNDHGISFARRLVKNGWLELVPDRTVKLDKELNETQTRQQHEILSCLEVAEQLSLSATARAEAYFACRLRFWVDAKRSDVSVYGVSPRAGSGDDLVGSMQEFVRRMAASAPAFQQVSAGLAANETMTRLQIKSNPSVIGFSVPPGRQSSRQLPSAHVEEATFGWAIRPEPMADNAGYLASRHRLSAVISVPSWWKRIEFDVQACWVMPDQVGASGQTGNARGQGSRKHDRDALGHGSRTHKNWYENLCENIAEHSDGFDHSFEIQIPRRVAEITDRFNFDFIKAPYFYRDFIERSEESLELSLEAGRPGKVVLHGERLWRGTYVTVNHQPANSIVVLPDMKGVVASFDCVHPPGGSAHLVEYNTSNSATARFKAISVPMQVWTSQGSTDPLPVQIFPYIQRVPNETPCWIDAK